MRTCKVRLDPAFDPAFPSNTRLEHCSAYFIQCHENHTFVNKQIMEETMGIEARLERES